MSDVLQIAQAGELIAHMGRVLGPGSWREVDQTTINTFVQLTGDRQWIHTDPERASSGIPEAHTIVPGGLLIALLPSLLQELYIVSQARQCRLAAMRDIRFRRALPSGEPFRLTAAIAGVAGRGILTFVTTLCVLKSRSGTILTASRVDVYED